MAVNIEREREREREREEREEKGSVYERSEGERNMTSSLREGVGKLSKYPINEAVGWRVVCELLKCFL